MRFMNVRQKKMNNLNATIEIFDMYSTIYVDEFMSVFIIINMIVLIIKMISVSVVFLFDEIIYFNPNMNYITYGSRNSH